VANGPEPVADSIVGQVLERKQQQEDDSRNGDVRNKQSFFEWQLLHGRRGDSTNGRTLAEAVEIFRVSGHPPRTLCNRDYSPLVLFLFGHVSGYWVGTMVVPL
jgi:hypothetical protein